MSGPDKAFQVAAASLVAPEPKPGMTYGRLRQRHPDYDAERMQELHDLHAGGYTAQKAAKRYLKQLVNEHGSRYDERCATAAYLGYFGQIVEQFTSDLFAQPLSITAAADADNPKTPGDPPDPEFYRAFEADCDLAGTAFVDLMKDALTTALVQRWAFVCIDAPLATTAPANRAEESALGQDRVYAYETSPRQVVDWKQNERGDGFAWAIVQTREQERATPMDSRGDVRETFTVWTMDGDRARWDKYALSYDPKDPPKDDTVVPYVDGGATTFQRLPLLRLELPKGLWVGNKVGPAQKEHWQRRSALLSAENRSMCAIPYVKRGPEIGEAGKAQPSDTQENPTRGRDPVGTFGKSGFVEIGAADELGYAEPEGKCYALVDKQLDELKDEIFRVTHQMAASVRPSAGSLGRSAASKQQDGKSTALVLRALGSEVRAFALRIYKTISEARGEDVVWTPNGLDNYEVIDREATLEEAISLDQVAIPSETFKVTYKTQVAEKLVTGMDPRTLETMRQEIKDGVHAEHAIAELARDAEKDAIENPAPVVVPAPAGPIAPSPKAPTPPAATAPKPGKKAA
jgi:hypothetical protein